MQLKFTESILKVYLQHSPGQYILTIIKVYFKFTLKIYTDLISQNVLQMNFFCRNNIDLKYTSSSVIQQVEVYFKYI